MREKAAQKVAETVEKFLGKEFDVQFLKNKKNNGLVVESIVIRKSGSSAAPIVPIDNLLNMFEKGKIGIIGIASDILDVYKNSENTENVSDIIQKLDKKYILERVIYQVINAEKNIEQLVEVPHKKFLDLAVIYRVVSMEDEFGMTGFTINHSLCNAYGISEVELDSAARKNTEMRGFCVQPLFSVLAETVDVPEEQIDLPEAMFGQNSGAWVLSSASKINGACIMLYSTYFNNLARKLEHDLYVLPSSVHEVLAVPVGLVEPYELRTMVNVINADSDAVAVDDVLSNNIYLYSREEDKLSIVL